MRESPLVSVVMSVFNGESFLVEAVESILAQTFRDLEFVVIDDGSIDGTAEILARYASQDERMRVYRHENRGRAESLNIGISLARGKYIARMDADDIALPDRLREQVEFMECHQEVGLLSGAVQVINAKGQMLIIVRPPLEDPEIRLVMERANTIYHPTVLMRKELVVASGGYRKALLDADDYDLFLRIGERSKFASLFNLVLLYRIHANQVSIKNMTQQTLCLLAGRAAASLRRRNIQDPLLDIKEVTPQFLETLGVTTIEMKQALRECYSNWMRLLINCEPEVALEAINRLVELSADGCIEKPVLADAWLSAVSIHFRKRRYVRALVAAGRAALIRPRVVGGLFNRVVNRYLGMKN
jgi:glycosyltransferase involved in cell wall biosynthesis